MRTEITKKMRPKHRERRIALAHRRAESAARSAEDRVRDRERKLYENDARRHGPAVAEKLARERVFGAKQAAPGEESDE